MMRPWIRRASGLAMAGLLAASLGCGGGKPSVDTTNEEATVKGTVTLKGKPLAKGEIRFDASNYLRKNVTAKSAELQPDGSYQITTLVGANRITFLSPMLNKDPALQESTVEFDVKSGENTLDIALPLTTPAP